MEGIDVEYFQIKLIQAEIKKNTISFIYNK